MTTSRSMKLVFNSSNTLDFPGGSDGNASAYSAGDLGLITGSGTSPGEGNGNPLQYSCLENPMDGGAWWATVHGVKKSRTRLSDFTFTFSLITEKPQTVSPWTGSGHGLVPRLSTQHSVYFKLVFPSILLLRHENSCHLDIFLPP